MKFLALTVLPVSFSSTHLHFRRYKTGWQKKKSLALLQFNRLQPDGGTDGGCKEDSSKNRKFPSTSLMRVSSPNRAYACVKVRSSKSRTAFMRVSRTALMRVSRTALEGSLLQPQDPFPDAGEAINDFFVHVRQLQKQPSR